MRMKIPVIALLLGLVFLVVIATKFLSSSPESSPSASTHDRPSTVHTVLPGKSQEGIAGKSNTPDNPAKPQARETNPGMQKALEYTKERVSLKQSQKVERYLVALSETLGLSPGQKENIRSILMERDAQQQEIGVKIKRLNSPVEMAELRRAGATTTLDAEEKLKGVLTSEQAAAYNTFKSEQRQTEVEDVANRQLAELSKQVVLTISQKDQIFPIYANAELQFDPIQLMAAGEVPEEKRKQLSEDVQLQLEKILTPSQLQLLSTNRDANQKLEKKLN